MEDRVMVKRTPTSVPVAGILLGFVPGATVTAPLAVVAILDTAPPYPLVTVPIAQVQVL